MPSCDITVPGLNLVAAESGEARNVVTSLCKEPPDKTVNLLKKINDSYQAQNKKTAPKNPTGQLSLFAGNPGGGTEPTLSVPSLSMSSHHYVPLSAQLKRALETAYDRQPDSFETLVSTPGVGAGSLRALALVAEIVHALSQATAIRCGIPLPMVVRTATPSQWTGGLIDTQSNRWKKPLLGQNLVILQR